MNTSNVYQKHLDLDKRIKIEKGIDKVKDAVYPYVERAIKNDKTNQEVIPQNRRQNSNMVVGRGLLDNSSFSLKEKHLPKLLKTYVNLLKLSQTKY